MAKKKAKTKRRKVGERYIPRGSDEARYEPGVDFVEYSRGKFVLRHYQRYGGSESGYTRSEAKKLYRILGKALGK